jgi:CRISPR-associated exonuclease Cas4
LSRFDLKDAAMTEHGHPDDTELLSLSGLQHIVFCPRQCALIHVEGLFTENRFTLEGHFLHERVDKPRERPQDGCRVVRALPLVSRRLGVFGVADVVEFHPQPYPVEYKRGRRRHREADQVQLCAQAMALEEMFSIEIPEGALFYDKSKRRQLVQFDERLRSTTMQAAADFHALMREHRTPPPVNDERCEDCSLRDFCLPAVVARQASVRQYVESLYEPVEDSE